MAVSSQLELESITCEKCYSGEDAIKLINRLIVERKPLFDVILTDYSMPGLSGAQTAIKQRKLYRKAAAD